MYANTAYDPPQRLSCVQVEHSRRCRTFANDKKFRLQHYLCQMDPNATSNTVSHREFQMAFQHWVAYIRPRDCIHPSEATVKEHLMCPMLWCRENFDDLASTLQHVSECPWLSNAWYWCPYCRRPENFMAYEEPCAGIMQYKLQRKDSKLRRAVTFFKHLGLKSCSRHKSSGSSSTSECFDTWLAKRKRCEMEDTSHDITSPKELADTKMATDGHRLIPEQKSKTVYEMEGTTPYNPWDLDELPHYSQEATTAVEPCELDVGDLVMARQSNGPTRNSHGSLTGIGAQFEVTQLSAEPWEEMVSPVSTIGSPLICQSNGSCHTECGLISPTYSNFNTAPSLEINESDRRQFKISPTLNGSLLSSGSLGGLSQSVTSSTQSQVEELRETVRILNEEWIQRCQLTPNLIPPASALCSRSLFVTGIWTLQNVFRGILPQTFEAVYALAHITCASVYIMHGDDTSHCWTELFQDMLKWQYLMPNGSDAEIFIQLLNLLWWPRGSSPKLSCGKYFLDETSGTLVPLRKSAVDFDASSPTETDNTQAPRWSPVSMSLLASLKTGAVFQECARFLDGKPTHQHPFIIIWPDCIF